VLNFERRIKVSRQQVKQIIRRSLLLYPFRTAWNNLARNPGA
jgi:hypothetical protein